MACDLIINKYCNFYLYYDVMLWKISSSCSTWCSLSSYYYYVASGRGLEIHVTTCQ